ncbi:MAG: PIN domain-containing protein, partial [Anaerolineae bacterium]
KHGEKDPVSDYLLDTDVLVRCLRGMAPTIDLARELTEEGDLHISVWSHLEILTLAHTAQEKRTLDFLTPFIQHPVNEPIARRAAELVRGGASGARLNMADAIIAATALQHGLTVVTFSQGLKHVDQLKLYPLP